MIRPLTLVSFACSAAAAGFLFVVAHHAQQKERQLDRISKAIHDQREAIVVLEAEWAYLNRLERLQQLTQRNLQLVPVLPERIVRTQDLPLRPLAKADEEVTGRAVPQGSSRGVGGRSR